MKIFSADQINLELPPGHRFPGIKYAMLRRRLLADCVVAESELSDSPVASRAEIEIAHDRSYVASIADGTAAPGVMRRIGFPASESLWRRSAAVMGGALAAARTALKDGVSGQLAGGTHHAHRDFGAGYCVFNDFAIAALTLIAERRVARIAVVDLDVHQGDGNATLLAAREDVFVFSMHGARNFPFRKAKSTLDVDLPDGVEDEDYLRALADHLPAVWDFKPDIVFYQAGVDPLREDRLGRMALTHRGLAMRDRMVLEGASRRGVPVSLAIGGGYANEIGASVAAYANTWREVRRAFG